MTVLLIVMPTQGTINTKTVSSLIGLTQHLRKVKIPFAFQTYEFSDIVFSRNQLASMFLTQKRYTHMLMLDSDMIFTPQTIMRLIEFDADFTAAPYAQKKTRWELIRQEIEKDLRLPADQRRNMEEILSATWVYNHQPGGFPPHPFTPKHREGFVTTAATGTGMMCISRKVVEEMVAKGAARPLPGMSKLPLHKGLEYHDFFSHISNTAGDKLYAEDQSFCHRWTVQCGGDIWLDSQAKIGHEGSQTWNSEWQVQIEAGLANGITPELFMDQAEDNG